ncbi:hypothetical protein MLD38_039518 [Melastoma candidum]|uniref:Uncharacterized protein n=1 Tax=Melastoma candidum TaxID=119954 RepID=A0ACB9L2B2_9MYRT|nr:hypothetical protein MLD38_039518 [Melastoma candidum]
MRKSELINRIVKLGLSDLFRRKIKEAVNESVTTCSHNNAKDSSVYHAVICFRLLVLLQYGHDVSHLPDYLLEHRGIDSFSEEALVVLLEASYLTREDEAASDAVRAFSVDAVEERMEHLGNDLSIRAFHFLELCTERVQWLDVRWQIEADERSTNRNPL